MYKPFDFSDDFGRSNKILESLQFDPLTQEPNYDSIFTEAVFADGKSNIDPMVKTIEAIKNNLMEQIKLQDETAENKKDIPSTTIKKFNPNEFWRSKEFKELEDQLQKVFGFRIVEIQPYIEKYNSTSKQFESRELNCYVYHSVRYPIDGLVTDKGFYDKTHSLHMDVHISLGLIKALEPAEIMGVLLHEFGHNIDPAIVDIKYVETNILSKYLTDRKGALNKREKQLLEKQNKSGFGMVILLFYSLFLLIPLIGKFCTFLHDNIIGNKKVEAKIMDDIKEALKKDKAEFNKVSFSEAFADNFARMYGYGPSLALALKKMDDSYNSMIKSHYKKDLDRRKAIARITVSAINDVHKTDIHRVHALIKEYEKDIDDPNTPDRVKKNLKEDLEELKKVLDSYLNDKDEFQQKINNMVYEDIVEKEKSNSSASDNKDQKNDKDQK